MDSQIFKIIDPDPKPMDHYSNLIFEKTGLLPSQCYKVNDDKDIFVKFIKEGNEKTILGANNIKKFKEIGLEVKLSADQIDKNTIFVNSAPISILDTDPNILLEEINKENPNITALSIFAPPIKSYRQKLTTMKITLASRTMTNACFKFGIKIKGCLIPSINIKQGLYLKTPQCLNCNGFHPNRQCNREHPACSHCGGNHKKYICNSNNPRPFCINCRGPHRATSNQCPIRREHLSEEFIGDVRESELICPFLTPKEKDTYVPAPAPDSNFWEQPHNRLNQNNSIPPPQNLGRQSEAPLSTYNDCLKLATNFKQWYQAFLILQSLMGLKKLELPDSLRKNIIMEQNNNTDSILLNPTNNSSQGLTNPGPNEPQPEVIPFFIPQRPKPQSSSTRTPNQSYHGQPLTGANLIPLPQRSQPQKRALLPTPPDPFIQVNRSTGTIPKPRAPPPNTANSPPIRTQNPFEILADETPFQFSNDDGWDAFKKPTKESNKKITSIVHSHSSNSKNQNEAENSPSNTFKDLQLSKITNSQTNLDNKPNSPTERPNSFPQTSPTQIQTNLEAPNQIPKIPNQNKPPKPPIKSKPDLSKYKPTQEIPSFIKNKLPNNRHSMDPKQFRSTILSFEALSNAALKKAELEYINTKEDFLMNTSLPEFKNNLTDNPNNNTQKTPNYQEHTQNPSPNEGTITNIPNTTYTLGTTKTPDKSIHIRKHYKHPTPSPQNSDSELEEINVEAPISQEKEDSDSLPDLANSPRKQNKRRLLRSNSKQNI